MLRSQMLKVYDGNSKHRNGHVQLREKVSTRLRSLYKKVPRKGLSMNVYKGPLGKAKAG